MNAWYDSRFCDLFFSKTTARISIILDDRIYTVRRKM
jgi:hypothetical protein